MGLFDWIRCKMKGPGGEDLSGYEFQTKDLLSSMQVWEIAEDGTLMTVDKDGSSKCFLLSMYALNENNEWIEYMLTVDNMKVSKIERVEDWRKNNGYQEEDAAEGEA